MGEVIYFFLIFLLLSRRLVSVDSSREPAVGERVTYYLAPPPNPNSPLIGCVKAAEEAWQSTANRMIPLNFAFYIDHQLLPPLRRMADLVGWSVDNWLRDLPRCAVRLRTDMDVTASQDVLSQPRGRRPSVIMRNFLQPARALHCLGCGDPGGVVCGRCVAEDPWVPTKLLIENGVEVRRDIRLAHLV